MLGRNTRQSSALLVRIRQEGAYPQWHILALGPLIKIMNTSYYKKLDLETKVFENEYRT